MESVTAWAGSDTDFPSGEHSELVDRPVTESVTTWPGIDTDFISDEHSELVNRPVTESVTARDGSDTDFSSSEHSEFVDQPVTESVSVRAGSDTDFHSDEHSEFLDRPVTESVTARATDTFETLVVNVSTVVTEESELREMGLCETDKRGIPAYREKCVTESQWPRITSPVAFQQMDMSNYQYHGVDDCFGVCGKTDSVQFMRAGALGRRMIHSTVSILLPTFVAG